MQDADEGGAQRDAERVPGGDSFCLNELRMAHSNQHHHYTSLSGREGAYRALCGRFPSTRITINLPSL